MRIPCRHPHHHHLLLPRLQKIAPFAGVSHALLVELLWIAHCRHWMIHFLLMRVMIVTVMISFATAIFLIVAVYVILHCFLYRFACDSLIFEQIVALVFFFLVICC